LICVSVCNIKNIYVALTIFFVIIFVTANLKTELKEVKPKLIRTEEKAGGIKSKFMLNMDFVALSLCVSAWHQLWLV
jgi:hypothetical protein